MSNATKGAGIRLLRKYVGDTQAQFANKIGVTQRTVQAYERDEFKPSSEVEERILALHIADDDNFWDYVLATSRECQIADED